MYLSISKEYAKDGFISFLIKRIVGTVSILLDIKKLTSFDNYFKSEEFLSDYGTNDISARKVILLALNNIRSKITSDAVLIYIDDNIYYPNTDIKLITLCKVINYGTLSIPAYPIFTNVFNHFKKDIKKYRQKFIVKIV